VDKAQKNQGEKMTFVSGSKKRFICSLDNS